MKASVKGIIGLSANLGSLAEPMYSSKSEKDKHSHMQVWVNDGNICMYKLKHSMDFNMD